MNISNGTSWNFSVPKPKLSRQLAPVLDLDYDLSCAEHTHGILAEKIRLLAEQGFKRIYIISPPPDSPDYSYAVRLNVWPPEKNTFLACSRDNISNPMEFAVKSAQQAGLEVFAVFKPYEGGGIFTVPRGHHLIPDRPVVECLGGLTGVSSFIAKNPELRVKRRPAQKITGTITEIEFVFNLDDIAIYPQRSGKTVNVGYQAISDKQIAALKSLGCDIFTSRDNGSYTRSEFDFTIRQKLEKRDVVDANGCIVCSQARCWVVRLSDLQIETPFFAVKFHGDNKNFRTIPYSMVRVFSNDRSVEATVSPVVRDVVDMTSEFESNPPVSGDFCSCGFEFEPLGPYYWDAGWSETNLFGFAVGREPYLRGSLCEASPKVREYWLDQIRSLVSMGVDGIDIRLMSHCSGITDFTNYGFNQELVDAYYEQYQVDIGSSSPDPIKMMKLRGMFFLRFLGQTAACLRNSGVKLQLHLKNCLIEPRINPMFHEAGFWAMPKVVPPWRQMIDLADEITIKDYSFNSYDPANALDIKRYAASQNKNVWVHCYLQQGGEFNRTFLNAIAQDPYVNGILLYETVYNHREDDGLIEVMDDKSLKFVERYRKLLAECMPLDIDNH